MIGKLIKKKRKELGISGSKLASHVLTENDKVATKQWMLWVEKGQDIRLEQFIQISKGLGIEPDELLREYLNG